GLKGIKREFSVPRTPQQNGIAERKNKTLIKAARTLLADSLLPIPFWAEAVNTACYNNNKDALVDGKEHDDDIQKFVSPDIHSSSSGAQTRKQGDKTENKDKEADINNLESIISVSPIPTTRIHKDHPTSQIIGDLSLTTQTKKEPKRVHQALKDPSWIEAMQEELLQFKMQKVWILVDLPSGKRAIGLQVKQKKDGIFISQDTYVADILRKFGLSEGISASTLIDTEKPLLKDSDGEDVDVHTY
nr:ribonuclease H-like domain-containing protein [Tanacetum cinerariifolium]